MAWNNIIHHPSNIIHLITSALFLLTSDIEDADYLPPAEDVQALPDDGKK